MKIDNGIIICMNKYEWKQETRTWHYKLIHIKHQRKRRIKKTTNYANTNKQPDKQRQ